MERPVGIAEHLSGKEDEIGLAGGNDAVGLNGIGNEADGGRGNVGFAPDSGGKLNLKTGTDGNLRVGDLAAGRNIDQVDATIAE